MGFLVLCMTDFSMCMNAQRRVLMESFCSFRISVTRSFVERNDIEFLGQKLIWIVGFGSSRSSASDSAISISFGYRT